MMAIFGGSGTFQFILVHCSLKGGISVILSELVLSMTLFQQLGGGVSFDCH